MQLSFSKPQELVIPREYRRFDISVQSYPSRNAIVRSILNSLFFISREIFFVIAQGTHHSALFLLMSNVFVLCVSQGPVEYMFVPLEHVKFTVCTDNKNGRFL